MSVETIAGGRYRVERELGHGGMASVYLARDEELERPVALKILAAHLASEPGFYERFVREARMAARLSHPNIVQVFDAGEEDERPFIVMEYVPGRTLAEEIRDRARRGGDEADADREHPRHGRLPRAGAGGGRAGHGGGRHLLARRRPVRAPERADAVRVQVARRARR